MAIQTPDGVWQLTHKDVNDYRRNKGRCRSGTDEWSKAAKAIRGRDYSSHRRAVNAPLASAFRWVASSRV